VDQIVNAAIELADEEGLTAVSVRRLAADLGVAAMTLYGYVPSKAGLLDLMLDALYLRMPRGKVRGGGWRPRLTAVANENRALYEKHPWAAEIGTGRPPLGPGQMAKYEHELSALIGAGFDDVAMNDALTLVLGFTRANAREAAEARLAQTQSGFSDEEWWGKNAPLLTKLVDPAEFPLAARVGASAGAARRTAFDPDSAYRFGLERILDGIGTLIGSLP
jgi:AcrR family transcriptional regulator